MKKGNWLAAGVSAYCLQKNEIHIWRANLNLPALALHKISAWLSPEESARAQRLINVIHQQRYRASHAILRDILAKYVGIKPHMLRFQFSTHGKPCLDKGQNQLHLQFNMTHSRDMALYAVTSNIEVGIDIEYIQSHLEGMKIAKRYFSENEYEQLLSLPEPEQLNGFYRCWTRKEAFLKAIGLGLSFPLKNFDMDLLDMSQGTLLRIEGNQQLQNPDLQWQIESIPVDDNFSATIAYPGEKTAIVYLDWEYCTY